MLVLPGTVTKEAVAVNVALLAPAGTVTLVGTFATAETLLASLTTAPPGGAALVRVTVPLDACPPMIKDGVRVSDFSAVATAAVPILRRNASDVPPPKTGWAALTTGK